MTQEKIKIAKAKAEKEILSILYSLQKETGLKPTIEVLYGKGFGNMPDRIARIDISLEIK